MSFLHFLLIDGDATVRTNDAARSTSDALVSIDCLGIRVTEMVDLCLRQCYDVFRTCHGTEVTSLAPLCVD